MAAFDSLPVLRTPPAPLATTSFPTYAPRPYETPVESEPDAPSTTAPGVPPTSAAVTPPSAAPTTAPPATSTPPSNDVELASSPPATVATVTKDRAVVFDAPKGK